ncbi:MAG: lipid II flippase MurJ, partial [Bacteroidales bacterium]
TAISPRLATRIVRNMGLLSGRSLKSVLVLSMPCAITFIVLSNLVVKTLFQFSGKVDNQSIALTASILSIFSVALITQSISTILNRGFYAANDTKTPLIIGASTIIANIALSYLFFKTTSLGARGMAVSYAIASIINAFLLLFVLDKKMQGLDLKNFLTFFLKLLGCCAAMTIVLLLSKLIFPATFAGSGFDFKTKILQLALLGIQTSIGFVVFLGCTLLLKVEEAQIMVQKIVNRNKLRK